MGRDANRLAPLAQLGAEPCVGHVEDDAFLAATFAGATAVYLVLPEDLSQPDVRAHQDMVSDSYARAIARTGVKWVVNLSSLGGQHAAGTGPIVGLHNQEQKLNRLAGLSLLHIRAGYFMENLFRSMAPLKTAGILPGGMPGDVRMPWIATMDIADYAAARLAARDFTGSSVQELHGQRDISMNEAASLVGRAVGRSDITYRQLPGPAMEAMLLQAGLPASSARLIVEMWEGANAGLMASLEARSARNTTPTALELFLQEAFAPAYRQSA